MHEVYHRLNVTHQVWLVMPTSWPKIPSLPTNRRQPRSSDQNENERGGLEDIFFVDS